MVAPASCAKLVVTAGPSGRPKRHKDASAITPVTTHERTLARSIQPASGQCRSSREGQAPAFYHSRPEAFVHELFLSVARFSATLAGKQGAAWFSASPPWRSRASRPVDVQVQVAPGLPAFNVVGLPDKAVSEARERVRAALVASGLALPARRITVNLAPADVPKEGSH